MWNRLFGCVSETLEISSQHEEESKSKSLKSSLNNLTNGSYTNLTNQDEIGKQQASIVQRLADSAGRLNKLEQLASPEKTKSEKKEKKKEKNERKKEKKLSQASTTITMTTNTVASKKKMVTGEMAPQFSRKQNEVYAQ